MAEKTEITLETVLETAPEELTDEQTTFLNENVENLTDEQKETFKDSIKEQEELPINIDEINPETRTKVKKQPKSDEEEEVDPEDAAAIGKVVDGKLEQVSKDMRDTKDQVEVDSFIRDNPEYSKYRAVALKYMKNSAYNNIPASNIIAMVSAKDQQKIGAKKEREATAKAKATQSAGNSVRKPESGGFDWAKATPEEMEAKKNEVLGRR